MGVKRVIFASSQHATGGFYLDEPWKHIVTGDFAKLDHGQYELIDETCRMRLGSDRMQKYLLPTTLGFTYE